MNLFFKNVWSALALLAGLLASSVVSATPITMDFDGLTPFTSVHKYYDGGCARIFGIKTNCHGADYGVVWKNAIIVHSADAHSPSGFAGLLLGGKATMNVAAGFDGGLSFFYYNTPNLFFSGGVSVYSGLNGHGALLSSGDFGRANDWDFFDLTFSGVAQSVIFHGSPWFFTGFDDVTLGLDAPANPVPEPAALGVFGLGVLLMGLFAGLRRRYG
ncbi:MAG: PEP-CTERM sorting domain-containing protein [Rhodanobacter sp.]